MNYVANPLDFSDYFIIIFLLYMSKNKKTLKQVKNTQEVVTEKKLQECVPCCKPSKDCPSPTPWCCEWCPNNEEFPKFIPASELDDKVKDFLSNDHIDYHFYSTVWKYLLYITSIVILLYLISWIF